MDFAFDTPQKAAVNQLENGKILCGDVGSGKSRTSLVYYYTKVCGGSFEPTHIPMKNEKPLVIITTAKKRDGKEWEEECAVLGLTNYIVDSWNNISKYIAFKNSFFIFDEQRIVGSGAWVDAFYKITRKNENEWILLSATPGDKWEDYIPVFVANGFVKNRTAFKRRYIQYDPYSKFPRVVRYLEVERLERMREYLLVTIDVIKHTVPHMEDIVVDYDIEKYRTVSKDRKDPETLEPILNISQYTHALRKVVNDNPNRDQAIIQLKLFHPRIIIFYNYDYERDRLISLCESMNYTYSEWNGHQHNLIPDSEEWVYLVQYTSGAEGWNCITTDTLVFYSLNYSYRITKQACGRIDRRNTPYKDLYYFFIRTNSYIDRQIKRSLNNKENFNERKHIVF